MAETSEPEHPTAEHSLQFHRVSFPHTIKINVAVSVKWEGGRQTLCISPKLFTISEAGPHFQCLGNQSFISFTPFWLLELELNGNCIKKYWGRGNVLLSLQQFIRSYIEKNNILEFISELWPRTELCPDLTGFSRSWVLLLVRHKQK